MKPPLWLKTIIYALIIFGSLGLLLSLSTNYKFLSDLSNFALILTLAAVLLYVHYTYLIAKDTWTPSASFTLEVYPNDPYHFYFIIHNHSKLPLNCWCKLNPTVCGQTVSLDGFYGGKSSYDVQPFGNPKGHFDIRDILSRANRTLQEMKQKANPKNIKEQLYLDIDFWYNPVGSKLTMHNPCQPHFFDFTRDVMIADF